MKRVVMLIWDLVLMLYPSSDGGYGNAKFVSPYHPAKSLNNASLHYSADEVLFQAEQGHGNWRFALRRSPGQTTVPVIRPIRKIIFSSYLSSAGGIPG